jgi:hypothetical protein
MFAVTDSLYVRWLPSENDVVSSGVIESFPFINRIKGDTRAWDGVPIAHQAGGSRQWNQEAVAFRLRHSTPQHGKPFNLLGCEGRARRVRILDLFDVKKSASNWNSDH